MFKAVQDSLDLDERKKIGVRLEVSLQKAVVPGQDGVHDPCKIFHDNILIVDFGDECQNAVQYLLKHCLLLERSCLIEGKQVVDEMELRGVFDAFHQGLEGVHCIVA